MPALLAFCLLTTFVQTLCAQAVSDNSKKNYNIGILVDNKSSETDILLDKLQRQILAVVGEDANIKFPAHSILVNNYNLVLAKQHYQQLLINDTDIIIAFGVINNEVLNQLKIHKKPTILFGAINQDYHDLDISRKVSGIENFTYLIESESYTEDLIKLKQLTNYQNIGIVIDEAVVDFLPLKQTFDQALKDSGASYRIIPFKTVTDITTNLAGLDAVYIAGGFFLKPSEVQQLAQVFINNKLPSFTLNGIDQVKNGIMASHQAEGDIGQFFRRISLTIEAYISGTPLAEMPVFIDYTSQLTINYNTAEAIGVPIKYSLISEIDFVGDFDNGNHKKKYNLTSIINQIVDKNLNLKSSRMDVKLGEQDVKIAKSNYLPSISASASGVYVDPDLAVISNGSILNFLHLGKLICNKLFFRMPSMPI